MVVGPGDPPPPPWAACPRVVVGPAEAEDPAAAAGRLHDAWATRTPVVVELDVDPAVLRVPQRHAGPVYELTPGFEFPLERLAFLVWANTYDARGGEPRWWHGRRAARRMAGAGVREGGPADVVLADGTALYVDGGPADPPPMPSGIGVVHRWAAEAGRMVPATDRATGAQLAPDQLAAVAHRGGPARVIAPAGSGKTRVLTERLRHLLADRSADPHSICALAYNTRAADEMRQRCADVLGPTGPQIRTLNSIGLWICSELGPGRRPRVLPEREVRDLLQQRFEIRRVANADTVAPYLDALAAVRLGLQSPAAAEEAFPDATGLAAGFDGYRSALADLGAMDFDEQIYRAIEILVEEPEVRAAAQARCRRMLVDEFQDLTPAHLLLIRLLCAPGFDCFGVGDDDQVIYGHAGASPEFLIQFGRYFPGAGDHPLEVNYRCPPDVVRAAGHLLSHNRRRVAKVLRSPSPTGDPNQSADGSPGARASLVVRRAPAAELARAAVDVVAAWGEAGVAPDQIAVLARVNAALLPVQVACAEAGVPSSAPLGPEVLGRTGIRTAFAYLRIATDPGHIRADDVRDTIRRPSRGVAPMVVDMLTSGRATSVHDVRRLAARLSGRDVAKLRAYADDLDAVVEAGRHSSEAVLRTVRVGIGLGATLDVLDASRRDADRSTHIDDLVALESVASLHPDPTTFASWLRELLGRPAPPEPAVVLSTIHRIKGKEWDRVVLYGASEGLMPHRLSEDEEGERRVFHVALTRARVQVVVLADAGAPSPFVDELDRMAPEPNAADGPAERSTRAGPGGGSAGATGPGRARARRGGAPAVGQGAGAGDRVPGPGVGEAEAALRAWRGATAKGAGVPAYVVLNDAELAGVAARDPVTLADLARCRGMGPVRLERWGDDILAVLDGVRAAAEQLS
ncbi:MAG TPA: ATP-dependent DNA helicase UvrD2 [Acidimicrobiales bacterium]